MTSPLQTHTFADHTLAVVLAYHYLLEKDQQRQPLHVFDQTREVGIVFLLENPAWIPSMKDPRWDQYSPNPEGRQEAPRTLALETQQHFITLLDQLFLHSAEDARLKELSVKGVFYSDQGLFGEPQIDMMISHNGYMSSLTECMEHAQTLSTALHKHGHLVSQPTIMDDTIFLDWTFTIKELPLSAQDYVSHYSQIEKQKIALSSTTTESLLNQAKKRPQL